MGILQNEIVEHLLTLIEHGKHGDRLPSQNELRDEFSVSTVTVRKALEKLEARGVIYRLQGKGCFVRHPEDAPSAIRLFLIVPHGFSFTNEFIFALVNETQKLSCHTVLYNYDGNDESLFHELQRISPQIVLWLAPTLFMHEQTLRNLLAMPLHVILFNRDYDHPSVNFISGDFKGDGRAIGVELAKKGVRKVLFLSFDTRTTYSKGRCEGLCQSIEEAGGKVDVLDVKEHAKAVRRELFFDLESKLADATAEILRKKHFDAIVCSQGDVWNAMRIGLAHSGQNMENMWFATFNELWDDQRFSPRIIAAIQPIAKMAEDAVALASRLLAGGKSERHYYLSRIIDYAQIGEKSK